MAALFFLEIMGAIFGPILLASMIADLTQWKIIMLVSVVILIALYFAIGNSDTYQTLRWRWSMPPLPPAETAFIGVADDLRGARVAAAADARKDAALQQTQSRLCALPNVVDNWVGRVEQRFLVNSRDGASLTIGIWPHLVVRTAFFPDSTGTLIRPGSPLFAQVNELRQGDLVRFSGRIVGHEGACPDDPPVDPNEKLRDPEFLLRFAQVVPLSGH
jgi:hypothetical protein